MREFPQTSYVMHPLGWVIPVAIITWIVMAACLLRTNRKLNDYEGFAWIVAGLMLTPMFYARGEGDWELQGFRANVLFLVWLVVFLTCVVCWFRVVRQNEGRFLNGAVFAIVASIVCSLFAIAPAMQYLRAMETRHTCEMNLHQIGIALDYYHEAHTTRPLPRTGDPPHSWRVALLPHIAYGDELYSQYDFRTEWDADVNREVMTSYVPSYVCPFVDWVGDDHPVMTSYALLVGENSAWTSSRFIEHSEIPDGAANTAIVAEACGLRIIWTEPRDIDLATTPIGINLPGSAPGHSPGILSTYHAKGANVLMADGSVRRFAIETDRKILEAIVTADGGEDVGEF